MICGAKDVGLSSEFYELEIGNIHNIFSLKNHIQLCEDCVKDLYSWVRQESADGGDSDV